MTNPIPDPEVYVTIDYSGFPPFADPSQKNWWTCLQMKLNMDFHLSENAAIHSEFPATSQRVI